MAYCFDGEVGGHAAHVPWAIAEQAFQIATAAQSADGAGEPTVSAISR